MEGAAPWEALSPVLINLIKLMKIKEWPTQSDSQLTQSTTGEVPEELLVWDLPSSHHSLILLAEKSADRQIRQTQVSALWISLQVFCVCAGFPIDVRGVIGSLLVAFSRLGGVCLSSGTRMLIWIILLVRFQLIHIPVIHCCTRRRPRLGATAGRTAGSATWEVIFTCYY